MDPGEAEELTKGLGQVHAGSWRVTASLIRLGLPKALGLSNEEWVKERLGGAVKLAVDERRGAAKELDADGMSQREIGAALGVDAATVNRDLASVANATAEAESPSSEQDGVANATPVQDMNPELPSSSLLCDSNDFPKTLSLVSKNITNLLAAYKLNLDQIDKLEKVLQKTKRALDKRRKELEK